MKHILWIVLLAQLLHALPFGRRETLANMRRIPRRVDLVDVMATAQRFEQFNRLIHPLEIGFDKLPATIEELHGRGSHRVGITCIPPAIGRLTRLRVLDLPFEFIDNLAPELLAVPLEELCLSSTRLADTPTYAHLPATLRRLELANVGMTRCPPRLAELLELRKLILNANLVEVPPEVRALPHLTELGLSKPR